MDREGRVTLQPLPKIEKVKDTTSAEGITLNALIDALQGAGLMEV
jgi:hypothetical protein